MNCFKSKTSSIFGEKKAKLPYIHLIILLVKQYNYNISNNAKIMTIMHLFVNVMLIMIIILLLYFSECINGLFCYWLSQLQGRFRTTSIKCKIQGRRNPPSSLDENLSSTWFLSLNLVSKLSSFVLGIIGKNHWSLWVKVNLVTIR